MLLLLNQITRCHIPERHSLRNAHLVVDVQRNVGFRHLYSPLIPNTQFMPLILLVLCIIYFHIN
jgi:hypothetical protein